MSDVKYSQFTIKTPPVSGNFVVGLDPAAASEDDKNIRIPVIDFALLSIANTFGDFNQTFKDNRILIESPDGLTPITIVNAQQTLARNLTIPILTANRTIVVTGESSQITLGTEVTGAITNLSDVTAKTGTGTTVVFNTSPVIVTPTIASFANALHSHLNAAGGGTITAAAISDFATAVAATTSVTANTAKVTNATHTGDATGATALTIASGVVTLAKMANIATARFIGRVTAATGVPEALTGTQATTLLNVFTSALKGLVPASGGGTTNFLRADGTFATPAGGGDMVLADVQTVTGAKTFNDTKLLLRNVANTFNGSFVNTNTVDRIYTLPNAAGTVVITGLANQITNTEIAAHTSTKITINAKGQLNSNIVYTDQINTFGDFVQTFKDNALHLENPAGTFDVVLQTSAEVTSDRILTIPLMGANRSMVLTGLSSQIALGTEVTGAITNLSDVTAKTGSGTIAVFDTSPTIVTPIIASFTNAGHNHQNAAGGTTLVATLALTATGTKDSTTFLRGDDTWAVPAGGGDMILASIQTVTGAKTFGTIGGAVGKFILAGSTSGSTILNAAAVAGAGTVVLPTTGTLAILGANAFTADQDVTGNISVSGTNKIELGGAGSDTFFQENAANNLIGVAGNVTQFIISSEAVAPNKIRAGTKAGDVIASELTTGFCSVSKNTTSGIVKMVYNDGGTVKTIDFDAGGGADQTVRIPLVMEVPEGTVGFPDVHALATAGAKISGMVLPDGASTSTINFKCNVPDELASVPAASIKFYIMTLGAVAGPADVRLTVSTLAVADTENVDQAFTAETETTVTMPTAIETMDVYDQDMTTDPTAGDQLLVQLKRDPTDPADDFTADIMIIGAYLEIDLRPA